MILFLENIIFQGIHVTVLSILQRQNMPLGGNDGEIGRETRGTQITTELNLIEKSQHMKITKSLKGLFFKVNLMF